MAGGYNGWAGRALLAMVTGGLQVPYELAAHNRVRISLSFPHQKQAKSARSGWGRSAGPAPAPTPTNNPRASHGREAFSQHASIMPRHTHRGTQVRTIICGSPRLGFLNDFPLVVECSFWIIVIRPRFAPPSSDINALPVGWGCLNPVGDGYPRWVLYLMFAPRALTPGEKRKRERERDGPIPECMLGPLCCCQEDPPASGVCSDSELYSRNRR